VRAGPYGAEPAAGGQRQREQQLVREVGVDRDSRLQISLHVGGDIAGNSLGGDASRAEPGKDSRHVRAIDAHLHNIASAVRCDVPHVACILRQAESFAQGGDFAPGEVLR
jgi:hypothetical protein